MMDQSFRLGLIGYGVAKVYAAAFQSLNLYYAGLPRIQLAAVATASEKSGQAAQAQFGFEYATTDYRQVCADESLDGLVIALPNQMHREVLLAALPGGKALFADKPLTANLAEALEVAQAAMSLRRDLHINFEYRFSPAIQKARQMVVEGRLGEIISFRGSYFRASYLDPAKGLRWKGSAEARGGAFDDLGAHLLDMLIWMLGMPARLTARKRTILPERVSATGERSAVGTEDHAWALLEYAGGATGTIETGRMTPGAVNDIGLEIYGTRGSLRWNQMDANYLYYADAGKTGGEAGWMQAPTLQDYPGAALPPADYPVGMMRYQIASAASFVKNTLSQSPYDPGLAQGLRVQRVLEAAHLAARYAEWVQIEE